MSARPVQKTDADTHRNADDSSSTYSGKEPIPQRSRNNIAEIIGVFADEPLWDEVMAEVKALRKRQNRAQEHRDK